MPTISDLFGEADFSEMQKQGFVRTQAHPYGPLRIANYTETAQYQRVWNDVTCQCRGLIYNTETREVLARPWKKFHNWDEAVVGNIPTGPMIKSPKMDGSLGILYPTPDDGHRMNAFAIASRGSFDSEQSRRGTRLLMTTGAKHGFQPRAGLTYLFEIIYPENRIVVDYGDFSGLVLLDVLDLETGAPVWAEFDAAEWPHKAEKTSVPGGFSVDLTHEIKDDEEGFVLYWPSQDLRVKMKGATYVHLHRIITNCTARTVWEYLQSGRSFDDLLISVPDEFYAWVHQTSQDLRSKFDDIEVDCLVQWNRTMAKVWHHDNEHLGHETVDRKEFALDVGDFAYKSVLFRMLDDRPYDDIIWKIIRPEATKPFWSGDGGN